MNGCIEIARAFVGVEVNGEEGASYDAKGVTLPVGYYLGLSLEVVQQFDVDAQLLVDFAQLVDHESALEETQLVDVDFLVLLSTKITTFRMTNLRVRKLLFSSISKVFVGSMLLRMGLHLRSGSDFSIRKGTA
jgi:hypothetical protein